MSYIVYLVANFAALSAVAFASRTGGWRLAVALVILGLGVGSVNILIEAYAFGVTDLPQTLRAAASHLPVFLILGPAAAWLSDRFSSRDGQPLSPRVTPLRLLAVMIAYMILYLAAGMLAYPHVQAFYSDKVLPPLDRLVLVQAARALIFVVGVYPLLRLAPRFGPVVLGLALSVVGGVAPLIPDNAFMPPDIRWVHGIEVGVSNFLFGAILALLLRPRGPIAAVDQADPQISAS